MGRYEYGGVGLIRGLGLISGDLDVAMGGEEDFYFILVLRYLGDERRSSVS